MARKRREFKVYIGNKTPEEMAKYEADATKSRAYITWLTEPAPSADDTAKTFF